MDALDALRTLVADVVKDLAVPHPSSPPLEYLTTAEAAERTRVTVGTVQRWVAQGRLTEHRVNGRLRIARIELDAMITPGRLRAPRRGPVYPETIDERAARLLTPARHAVK